MKITTITQVTIGLALITATTNYGAYIWPFRFLGDESFFYPAMIGTNILAILFLPSPILSLYFYPKKKNACYFWLGLFALPAFIFGIIPNPFSSHLYTNDHQLNTIFIAIIDIGFVIFSWYLYRANKTFQPTPKNSATELSR